MTADAGRRSAEIAWVVAPDRQRQGLATEAARAMVEWLSEREVTDLPDTLAEAGWTTD